MKPIKRSFSIAGHRTSISLEPAFWDALKEAARDDGKSVAAVVAEIDRARGGANLSSAVRVWLLHRYRDGASVDTTPAESAATETGSSATRSDDTGA